MIPVLTRHLPIRILALLAGMSLLGARASEWESSVTEAEDAVRTWRTQAGLPADSVTAIIQSRDGFLWVGTTAGLARFDGVKFTALELSGTSNAPVRITALCEDNQGHLWIGTQQDGIFVLADGGSTHYTKTDGLLDDNITSLASDSQGLVWVGTRAGLNLITGGYFRAFTVRDGLPDDMITGVHVSRSKVVWITTRNGMCRYVDGHIVPYAFNTDSQGRSPEYLGAYEDRSGVLWAFGDTYLVNLAEGKRFNYFRGNEAASVRIWSLCEGRDGRLWIGTSGRGLFCFDENRFQPVRLGELRWPYDVRAICEDFEGNLWLGTSGGGLVQLRPQPVHTLRPGQGLPTSTPTALALDAHGRIYVGLARGGLFVGEAGRFERFGSSGSADIQEFVTSVCAGRDGTIWTGTLGGGLYGLSGKRGIQMTTANGLADDSVLCVCLDAEGQLWAATGAGTLHRIDSRGTTRFDQTQGLSGAPVTVVVPARTGGLWLGTEDGMVLRGEHDQFKPVLPVQRNNRRPILALHENTQGRLWVGTAGGGLSQLGADSVWTWTTSNGLPNDVISGIVEDASRNLWLVTGAGIYRISRAAIQQSLSDPLRPLACKLMSEAKTLYEAATASGGARALLGADGKLWFATSDGVLNVDARQPELEPAALLVYLESVAFNGQPRISLLRNGGWSAPNPIRPFLPVPVDVRSMEIHFTALNLSAPEQTRFRHRLEGLDTDWVDDGTTRFVSYGRLAYGKYKFRLAARLADGAWQETATQFSFEVPTPIYFQSWAIFMYGVFAVGTVAGVVRVVSHRRLRRALAQLEQQQSLERERMRIARDMHDEIGSKLTKISFLSEHVRMDAHLAGPLAGKIESIAETSRDLLQTMDEIVWVVNPTNDSLEHLVAYLGHYAVEYFQTTSVECDLRLPRAIPHHPLSSEARHNLFLAFEEALNNVLKHSGASRVKVDMAINGAKFEISIVDNGRGFAAEEMNAGNRANGGGRRGNGLQNMRQRLADIRGGCLIRSQPGEGTTIALHIPLHQAATRKS